MKLEIMTTASNEYPNLAPRGRSVAQLAGSMLPALDRIQIIFARLVVRICRCNRNRTGRGDQDFWDDSANVCTSTSTAPAACARLAQRNPSTPAQLRVDWHWDQDQSADEKPHDSVLAATARNGRESGRLPSVAGARRERK